MKTRVLIVLGIVVAVVSFASVLFAIPSWNSSYQEDFEKPIYGTTVYGPSVTENSENEDQGLWNNQSQRT